MMDLYFIFDGSPGMGSSRFIDVEDENRNSLTPGLLEAYWRQIDAQTWALGPFSPTPLDQAGPSQGGVDTEQVVLERVAAAAEKLTHAVGPGYVEAYNCLKEAVEELDQLRGERT